MSVNRARLVATLRALLEIESPSGQEANLASYLIGELGKLAGQVLMDAAGNVIAYVRGDGEPIILNAHMDTVMPTSGLRIVEKDGRLQSDGSTILGADDKAGIAAILEVVRCLHEQSTTHLPVEVVFTISEEIGLVGAKKLDFDLVTAKRGLCMDSSGPPGEIVVSAPVQTSIDVTIIGKAAHAGMAPERGISAIVVAAEAIAALRLGRIDEQTTANVGTIQGGTARNIVPEKVVLSAEVRSRDEAKMQVLADAMVKTFEEAAARHGASVELDLRSAYRAFNLSENEDIVRLVVRAAQSLGLNPRLAATGGGSDANVFNERGIRTVNLGVGYDNPHSPSEYVDIDQLVQATELLCAALRG